ncbi:MAG: AAA family ATPase [Acetobacteraceae bacterium]|nr:AAA family ATPase [Acetobacteraceae bacterium]
MLVTGEPGIGKSRLVRAVQDRLAGEGESRLRYFCAPHHQGSALYPVIAQLEGVAGLGRADPAAMRLAKLEALLARSDASNETVALVAALLSIPTDERYRMPEMNPPRLRERTLAALLGLFAGLVARGPAVVAFEDLHWADPTTLEVLARAAERVASMPVLMLMTARPEFRPPWPDLAHGTTLPLSRLSDDEAAMLAQQAAGAVPLPDSARRYIVRHTEGVPLFVEELTKAVLESGALTEGERFASLPLPTSLHHLLLARLDRLGPAHELAQIGAVIGREFTYDLLSAVADQPEDLLKQSLTQLVRSELLFRSGAPPDARYSFKHALVQQAAYESLPRSRRTALHLRAVEALTALDPDIETTRPEVLARHCEQGGLIERAARLYTRAAFGSTRRGAYSEANEQFANAARMVRAMPEGAARDRQELESLLGSLTAIRMQRGYASSEAAEAHHRAMELWDRLGRPAEFLEVPRTRFEFHYFRGEIRQAEELALHLLHARQRQADPRYHILAHLCVGDAMMIRGEPLGKAESHLRQTLALIRSGSNTPGRPWRSLSVLDAIYASSLWVMTHHKLGRVTCLLGYPDQAIACLSALLEGPSSTDYPLPEVNFWVTRVGISSYFTEAAELAPSVERLSKLAREFGLVLYEAWAKVYRGYVVACCGDPDEGIAIINEGRRAYTDIEVVTWSGYHRALLAEAHRRAGRLHEARGLLVEAQGLAERTGEGWCDAELARRLGEVDRQQGDVGAAERRFKQALAIARRQQAKLWELHAATSLARLWREQQRSAEARAVLAPVYGWFKEGLETSSLRRAKAVLDGLS